MVPGVESEQSLSRIASNLQHQSEFCTSQRAEYRADIDGLRALAVLSVVGYHYFGAIFRGGYIGVDIFFVISGYLLSGIIITEVNENRFSFVRFYERRIRRIFPALFALLAVSTLVAELFLLTPDLRSYLRSMLAASWSASNFYFWKTANYFDSPAANKPLLHTWSLAVEEQFYLLFPIFIFLVNRYFKRHLKIVVVAVAVTSFILSVVQVRIEQSSAFYLPYERAWELLLGTIIFIRIFPALRSQAVREGIACLGILLICIPIFNFTINTLFPGDRALMPCLGAAGIIFAGETNQALINRLLTWRPVVFIGLISYSLYLWHWPVLAFSNTVILPGLSLSPIVGRFILTILAFALAALSWRFIESPFRTGPNRPAGRVVYAFGAVCLATMSFCFFAGSSVSARSLRRFPEQADLVGSYIDYPAERGADFKALFEAGSCFLDRSEPVSGFREDLCLSSENGDRRVLVFGDSEAANLRYGLQSGFPQVHFLQATSSACPPLLKTELPITNECREFVAKVFTDFIPKYRIDTVLLSAGWIPTDMGNLRLTIAELQRRNVRVILFGPFPEYRGALPRLLAETIADGKRDYAREARRSGLDDLDRAMAIQAEEWHVVYLSLSQILCPKGVCMEYAAPGVPMQFDHVHLTAQGAAIVGQKVAEQLPDLFDVPPNIASAN